MERRLTEDPMTKGIEKGVRLFLRAYALRISLSGPDQRIDDKKGGSETAIEKSA